MVVYRISGGLGNQLFQYATGRLLSVLNNNADLYLDISSYEQRQSDANDCAVRHYGLSQLNISIAGLYEQTTDPALENHDLSYIKGANKLKYFSSSLLWDPRVLTLRGDLYVDSFGQGWRHLVRITDSLRDELTFRSAPDPANLRILEKIQALPSVSIHVRRTDYFVVGYSVCSTDYYDRAMSYMRTVIPEVRFFVFSDDPAWAFAQWRDVADVEFVTLNSDALSHEDLRLMAACKGNIIANSTFSWWGAWLNNSVDKIIIAPKTWKLPSESSQRMIPPGWIVM